MYIDFVSIRVTFHANKSPVVGLDFIKRSLYPVHACVRESVEDVTK